MGELLKFRGKVKKEPAAPAIYQNASNTNDQAFRKISRSVIEEVKKERRYEIALNITTLGFILFTIIYFYITTNN